MSSLNPRKRVVDIVGEAPVVHGLVDARARWMPMWPRCCSGSGSIPSYRRRYPHQFSGGQRQRIGIARALAVQARVPGLRRGGGRARRLDPGADHQPVHGSAPRARADLSVHQPRSRRGRSTSATASRSCISAASSRALRRRPSSRSRTIPIRSRCSTRCPRSQSARGAFSPIKGEIPSPLAPPSGCHFHPRCPHAFARCRQEAPALREIAPGHISACHLNDQPAANRRPDIAAAT